MVFLQRTGVKTRGYREFRDHNAKGAKAQRAQRKTLKDFILGRCMDLTAARHEFHHSFVFIPLRSLRLCALCVEYSISKISPRSFLCSALRGATA